MHVINEENLLLVKDEAYRGECVSHFVCACANVCTMCARSCVERFARVPFPSLTVYVCVYVCVWIPLPDGHIEKQTRRQLRDAASRHLSRDCTVILDSMNFIKGFRYEVYCQAREHKTPHCVVRSILPHPSPVLSFVGPLHTLTHTRTLLLPCSVLVVVNTTGVL